MNNETIINDGYIPIFKKRMALSTVFVSNKLEGTMPQGISESETYEILDAFYEEHLLENVPHSWDVDGESEPAGARTQLLNHFKAHQYLCHPDRLSRDLSISDLTEAHRIMMEDSTGMVGKGGEFRSHNCYAHLHVFPEGNNQNLEDSCTEVIQKYNSAVRNGDCFIESAAYLFYDMVSIHPFSDGNGRICRLLVTYAAMRGGFPFFIPMSSHHRKARNHYMNAIFEGDRHGKLGQMRSLILTSAHSVMRNYVNNKRLMGG